MSVIKKPDLKIFAQDAKTGEVETFPDILRGWGVTLDRTAGKPPLEWFNAIGKRVDEWLMYLTQRGVASGIQHCLTQKPPLFSGMGVSMFQ